MSSFQFKKFTIQHREDVFKFGTDAALLATWVDIENSKNILEIGTGSGVITLMMAQRNPKPTFTGIDISNNAIELATHNLASYPTQINIKFENESLQNFKSKKQFDHIISNPPFFENGTKSPSDLKNTTRHTDGLSLMELLTHAKRLLSPAGRISLIYPVRYLDDIKVICKKLDLFPTQIVRTRSTSNKPVRRVLISIGTKNCIPIENELIINGDQKEYSPEVFKMFKPFYLKL